MLLSHMSQTGGPLQSVPEKASAWDARLNRGIIKLVQTR
jgi:hypothetical protein